MYTRNLIFSLQKLVYLKIITTFAVPNDRGVEQR